MTVDQRQEHQNKKTVEEEDDDDRNSRARRILQTAMIAGPRNMAKAVGRRIASKLNHKTNNAGILNIRPLATINEPQSGELAKEFPAEQFHAPSMNTSINETVCSTSPPSIPNRRVSMDTASIEEYSKNKKAEIDSADMQTLADSLIFDRFADDTIACAKAPPSKPFKRGSMDSGFRDSMASTISALTMDASFASELGRLKQSFVSMDDEEAFCLDLEDSFISR